jgi:hypothetical protein
MLAINFGSGLRQHLSRNCRVSIKGYSKQSMRQKLRIEYADAGSTPETMGVPFGDDGWQDLGCLNFLANRLFSFTLTLAIGFDREEGTVNFSLFIVTADLTRWKNIPAEKRHYSIYFDEFDWAVIRSVVEARVYACQRDTLSESVEALRRVFLWEYEGTDSHPRLQ